VPKDVDDAFVHKLFINAAEWDGTAGKGEFVVNGKGERSQLHLRFSFTPASQQGLSLDCLICGLGCLICGLDCLACGLDCLMCGLDCLICGLDCRICAGDRQW